MLSAEKKLIQRRSGLFFLSSVVCYLVILALPLTGTHAAEDLFTLPVFGVGLVCWFLACGNYARSKGYPMSYGLLGFMTFIGLLWLVLLRDKTKGAVAHSAFVAPLPVAQGQPSEKPSRYRW